MNNPIIDRIEREAGLPDLLEVLAERLSPTDLQSLMLEVYHRRAQRLTPRSLLARYADDRFVRPGSSDPTRLLECERLAWSMLPADYSALELSPLCPAGTVSAIATAHQNKVVSTIRNTEVASDTTNALALECAVRRRSLLQHSPRSRERVRLAASQRVVRAQAYQSPSALAHFRLLGLCAAGRDEGSLRFEAQSLQEQIGFFLRFLQQLPQVGLRVARLRVAVTDLDQGRSPTLAAQALADLRTAYPGVQCDLDPDRAGGRGYYVTACFHIYAENEAGREFQLVDGGFTTWTQQLLENAKERLLISGLGTEVLCSRFTTA